MPAKAWGEKRTVPAENMRGKNNINEKKAKGEKKLNKTILAAYFMTYNRVRERGRKRILAKRRMGKIYDV